MRHAARLCESSYVNVFRYDGERIHLAASEGGSAEARAALRDSYPTQPHRKRAVGRVIESGRVVRIEDTLADAEYDQAFAGKLVLRRLLGVPLLRAGRPVGAITVGWAEAGPVRQRHEDLLKTFADQAVIAIENARRFNETREALERQTATAEILKVIASSPADVQPVFDAIAASSRRLLGGLYSVVARRVGDSLHLAANTGTTEAGDAALRKLFPTPISGQGGMGKAVVTRAPVAVEDVETDPSYSQAFREGARSRGMRSMLCVPMLREGDAIGVISVNRADPGPFSEHQTNLLKTFADQAVIAIENLRLFNETGEALERQTATAEILQVIAGSPSDLRPVFDAILRSATGLCDAHLGVLNLYDGTNFRTVAQRGGNPEFAKWLLEERGAFPAFGALAQMLSDRQPFSVADLKESASYRNGNPITVNFVDLGGARSFVAMPLLKEGAVIGNIGIYRPEVRTFADKQIELVRVFANQAVIAIENVRLFNETKEALEQQMATAEIIKVISESPTDTQPVFEAIVQSGLR
ncbi:MAG: GAF domain-containing protein, partial [Bradyrhizobium sp.]